MRKRYFGLTIIN